MLENFIIIIWFFLPAGVANMAAAISRYLPILNYPVDFNKTINGRLILGAHKTYRGLVFGMIAAVACVYMQRYFYSSLSAYSIVDYTQANIWQFGLLIGAGAMIGDLARSFIKRRRGIPPGQPWFPYDQIDWILGAIIFVYWYRAIPIWMILLAPVLAIIIHPLVNYICYLSGLQKNKF